MITSKYLQSLGLAALSLAKSSRHPGLQNPTTKPRYSVNESSETGLPERGQYLLIGVSIATPSVLTAAISIS